MDLKDMELRAIFGGIWGTPGITEQPCITLVRWRVLEVTEGPLAGERHLVGYNEAGWEGRVSTAIMSFDATTKECVTKSGRVYKLVGPACHDADGDYVWRRWAKANLATDEIDVSAEFS
ncbi:hypothetical protein [Citrifermentans bremense]|uniref:hypothetical protein n=1 Tax=Citrifermentans bremense TaxID=60035 RepID=UPI00068745A5|nr:hypothetical protein [Citrifermentans bremense]